MVIPVSGVVDGLILAEVGGGHNGGGAQLHTAQLHPLVVHIVLEYEGSTLDCGT